MKMNFLRTCALLLVTAALPAMAQTGVGKSATPTQIALAENIDPELVKEAGKRAIKELVTEFQKQGDLTLRRFAVLPLETDVDGAYFTNQVRDQFAVLGKAAGFELYTRTDEEWNTILREIAFGQHVGDTMNAETVQKFGRITGVQGLIMGRVVSVVREGPDVKVRFSLRAFEVETGRLLWGNEVSEYGHTAAANRTVFDQFEQRELWRYGAIGAAVLVGLFLLLKIARAMGAAARPR